MSKEASKQIIRNTLSSKAFWKVNKRLALYIGHVETILLSELIYQEELAEERGDLHDGEWFTCTRDVLEAYTGIDEKTQTRYCKKLQEAHFLETILQGIPRKKYYKVCHEQIEAYLKTVDIKGDSHKGQNVLYGKDKMTDLYESNSPDRTGQNVSINNKKKIIKEKTDSQNFQFSEEEWRNACAWADERFARGDGLAWKETLMYRIREVEPAVQKSIYEITTPQGKGILIDLWKAAIKEENP